MTQKFGRSYRIQIDLGDDSPAIVVTPPLTINFSVKRNTLQSLNYMTLDLYNLSKETRDRIYQDRYAPRRNKITFEGGYDSLSTIFYGNIFEAGSYRESNDIITRIEARDGSFDALSTNTFQTINKGKSVGELLASLAESFPELERGAIGEYSDILRRPAVLNGNVWELLKQYSDNSVFIDSGRVYALRQNEAVEGGIPVINTSTGLLGTPKRNDGFLSASTLFEPQITVGQIIDFESSILPVYNGQYKVVGVGHQGTISGAVGGGCKSTFDLFTGSKVFQIIKG